MFKIMPMYTWITIAFFLKKILFQLKLPCLYSNETLFSCVYHTALVTSLASYIYYLILT